VSPAETATFEQEVVQAAIESLIGGAARLAESCGLPELSLDLLNVRAGIRLALRPDSARLVGPPAGGYAIAGNWSLVPGRLRQGLNAHIGRGEIVGSFLTAVLENDLLNAACRADDTNRARLRDLMVFLHMDAPAACWGSPEKVESWRAKGGLAGQPEVARVYLGDAS
jgi:hypothetical protein